MNRFIHGIDGKIELGNSYTDDRHAGQKADDILANPPFDEGSKEKNGWGADRVADKDPRLTLGSAKLPLTPRNANTMWHESFRMRREGWYQVIGAPVGGAESSVPAKVIGP